MAATAPRAVREIQAGDERFDHDFASHVFPDADAALSYYRMVEEGVLDATSRVVLLDNDRLNERLREKTRFRFVVDLGGIYHVEEWPDRAMVDHHGQKDLLGETCSAELVHGLCAPDERFDELVRHVREVDNADLPENTDFEREIRGRSGAECEPWEYLCLAVPRLMDELAPRHREALFLGAEAFRAAVLLDGVRPPGPLTAEAVDRQLLHQMRTVVKPLLRHGEEPLAKRLIAAAEHALHPRRNHEKEMEEAYARALGGRRRGATAVPTEWGVCLAFSGHWPSRSIKTWAKRRPASTLRPPVALLAYRHYKAGKITLYTVDDDFAEHLVGYVDRLKARYGGPVPIVRVQEDGYVWMVERKPPTPGDPPGDRLVRELFEFAREDARVGGRS